MELQDFFLVLKNFFDYWQNLLIASGIFVAIFVAFWTVWNDRKNLKLNGLNLAFQKFNDPKSRKARKNILSAYHDFLINHDFPVEYNHDDFLLGLAPINLVEDYPDLQDDIENLKSDFEQVAVMTKNGLVDEKAYFDAFYGSMLRCFGALHGHIQDTRNKTGTKHYTTYFEKQCKKAVEYWKKNLLDPQTMGISMNILLRQEVEIILRCLKI